MPDPIFSVDWRVAIWRHLRRLFRRRIKRLQSGPGVALEYDEKRNINKK
jgi:hypothetical protein